MGSHLYKTLIVEDEEMDAMKLEKALKAYEEFNVVATASTLKNALRALDKYHPDLLFLDIEMPDGKGFTMLDNLRPYFTWPMKTVFYTAHDKYMLNAIRSEAFDYLLKPFEKQELDNILKKFIEKRYKEERDTIPNSTGLVQMSSSPAENECFILQIFSGDIRIVKTSDIGVFHYNTERRVWEVLLYNQEWIPLRSNIKPEQITDYSGQFIRTHQSFIINLSYLAMIHNNSCLMYPPFNYTDIPISNRYKKLLKTKFRQL